LAFAHEAFKKGTGIFGNIITKDPRKQTLAQEQVSLEDLERVVENAKARYEGKHKNNKASKWLARISHRVRYYGNIGDALVQQHPEYVALAWGAFKLLFVVSDRTPELEW
jgi:hypothetical protein